MRGVTLILIMLNSIVFKAEADYFAVEPYRADKAVNKKPLVLKHEVYAKKCKMAF